jgi:hypothetical protein
MTSFFATAKVHLWCRPNAHLFRHFWRSGYLRELFDRHGFTAEVLGSVASSATALRSNISPFE